MARDRRHDGDGRAARLRFRERHRNISVAAGADCDRETGFVLAGIAIPILKQGLMLAGPLFLYLFRGRFREPLDGLAFGVASGLGFSLATSLADFWPLLGGPLVANGSPIDWRCAWHGLGFWSHSSTPARPAS